MLQIAKTKSDDDLCMLCPRLPAEALCASCSGAVQLFGNPVAESEERPEFDGIRVLYSEPESEEDEDGDNEEGDEEEMYECERDCGFEHWDIAVVEAHEATCTYEGGAVFPA